MQVFAETVTYVARFANIMIKNINSVSDHTDILLITENVYIFLYIKLQV